MLQNTYKSEMLFPSWYNLHFLWTIKKCKNVSYQPLDGSNTSFHFPRLCNLRKLSSWYCAFCYLHALFNAEQYSTFIFYKNVVYTFCQQVTQKAKMYLYTSFYLSGMNKHIEDFLVLLKWSRKKENHQWERLHPSDRFSIETQITGL